MKYLKIILTTIMLCTFTGIANAETTKITEQKDSTSQCVKTKHHQTFTGKAAFYGTHYTSKRKTASGKRFDKNKLTAAHKTLPFGTKVLVTNLKTGKSVEVEITDRGTLGKGIIIDLTPKAFKIIGNMKMGIAQVKVEVISYPKK